MSTRHRVELAVASGTLIGILLAPVIMLMTIEFVDGDSGF